VGKKSPRSEAQGPRPEDSQEAKHIRPRQPQRAVRQLLATGQPLLYDFKSASQKRKLRRGIQAAAPATEGRRVRNAIRIFQGWDRAFPRVVLHKTSPQCLTTRDQTVMGIWQGESRQKTESMFADFAEPAAVLDPVVTVVMRLLAPPAMTNDRISQTDRTPGKDPFPTSRRPVEARLAMVRRKWDNGDRTAWEALSLSRISTDSAQKRAFLLPLNLKLTKDTKFFLSLDSKDWPVKRSEYPGHRGVLSS